MTFPHSATLSRTTKSGTKYTFGSNGTTECFLQPLDEQESQIIGITFGKGSHCYVPYDADVLEGDRMTIDTVVYGVRGLKALNYGNLRHKRLLLEQI